MNKYYRISALIIFVYLQSSCTSTPTASAPVNTASARINNFQLETHAEKIAWMKACELVVAKHENGKCLGDYFRDEVICQENKISHLDKDQQNNVTTRSDFLAKEYVEKIGALEQCIAAHTLGVDLMNSMNERMTKESNEASAGNTPLVLCVPREKREGMILDAKKK